MTTPVKKRRWTRWGWWTFVILNLAGLILIIPLLKVTVPLIGIWWDTRSQANFQRHQQQNPQPQSSSLPATFPANTPHGMVRADPADDTTLDSLTNQLPAINKLSDSELHKIVAWKFGSKKARQSDPQVFDNDSAVFDKIDSGTLTFNDQLYYCYEIDLVDQNGNHKISVEVFKEPNLDYERSKATMELVNRTPQLRKIYDAVAHIFAEQTTVDTNAPSNATTDEVIEIPLPLKNP